jgi:hypothetical protein
VAEGEALTAEPEAETATEDEEDAEANGDAPEDFLPDST